MFGIAPDSLGMTLHDDAVYPMYPQVEDLEERVAPIVARYTEEYGSFQTERLQIWDQAPLLRSSFEELEQIFTLEEILRLSFCSCISHNYYDAILEHRDLAVPWKVMQSMWSWGCSRNWNLGVQIFEDMKQFSFGVSPDFEVRLDYASKWNEKGWAALHRNGPQTAGRCQPNLETYLDGAFGFFVYHRGKHVLTIGFSPSRHGVLLHQVQLKTPRGNRWLYRIRPSVLEHVIERMTHTFRAPIFLVEGAAAVKELARAYPDDKSFREQHPRKVLARIRKTYNAPFERYERGRRVLCANVHFREIVRKLEAQECAA